MTEQEQYEKIIQAINDLNLKLTVEIQNVASTSDWNRQALKSVKLHLTTTEEQIQELQVGAAVTKKLVIIVFGALSLVIAGVFGAVGTEIWAIAFP